MVVVWFVEGSSVAMGNEVSSVPNHSLADSRLLKA